MRYFSLFYPLLPSRLSNYLVENFHPEDQTTFSGVEVANRMESDQAVQDLFGVVDDPARLQSIGDVHGKGW